VSSIFLKSSKHSNHTKPFLAFFNLQPNLSSIQPQTLLSHSLESLFFPRKAQTIGRIGISLFFVPHILPEVVAQHKNFLSLQTKAEEKKPRREKTCTSFARSENVPK
jgi:hypothetical protein